MSSSLQRFLRLSLGAFLLLLLINIGLPAIFLLLQVPSFAIGNDPFWLLRWSYTDRGSGIEFNVLLLLAIAIIIGLLGLVFDRHRH
ncbi:MAG: hypothetical protein KME17_08355 [Cyanosarcina radialis HA8281-LM2]|jgi:hypothetical protein|nr:hypothetical protein [Cyanosarcina radialis HA8281-LM2]